MATKKKTDKKATAPDLAPAPPPPELRLGVKVANQEYAIKPVESLRLHPRNAKKGNVEAIGESIEANDFYGAAVVQKSTGYILVGNHRYKAAIEKGMKEIPVLLVDCDDETAERINMADNRIADLGTYDEGKLFAQMEARSKAGGLKGSGYGDADLERMKKKLSAPSKFPEVSGAVKVKYKCPNCSYEWS